ncbi:hypothetical protein [Nonomuraea polychroma]|uniref:hypothetical protein n=1 Tax=Nonomuraea polychroma TaxID=46176 RepID=UPI000FDDBC9F|nr:hypothetical protein [Nonomuraea polychroma]
MTMSSHACPRRRRACLVRINSAILLTTSLLMSGCGYTTWQVDPAVLDEVRSIGRVIGESTSDGIWEDTNDIITTFVIDVGGKSGPESVDKTVDLLGKRGWKILRENRPTSTTMESPTWENDHLVVRPFHPAEIENEPSIQGMIKEKAPKPEALVVVWAWEGA